MQPLTFAGEQRRRRQMPEKKRARTAPTTTSDAQVSDESRSATVVFMEPFGNAFLQGDKTRIVPILQPTRPFLSPSRHPP